MHSNMRWSLVVFVTFVVTFNVISAQDSGKTVPILVRTLNDLHRGPPIDEEDGLLNRAVQTEYITQKLDHFDENENRTWQMRYMINDEYFKAGGPIFIYIGGEWSISAASISSGHFVDMAKKYNAIIFYTEHRFYGKSLPFDDLTVNSLKYLHVKQALEDLAHFIHYQRDTNPNLATAKVILSGCSYSASMLTWFRRLYPALVTGGWASSGPLLAKVDFIEYKEMVGKSFRTLGGEACYNRIKNGFAGLEKIWDEDRVAEMKSMFKICDKFDPQNDLDVMSLFASLAGRFSSIAQYQKADQIKTECKKLMDYDKDDVNALAKYILANWQSEIAASKCVDLTYRSTVDAYRDTTYALGASRAWYYQTCNEYGWYQSSGSKNQPFGSKFPSTFYITLCEDVFGSDYRNSSIHQHVADTNESFGALEPGISKVYTVHGALDPWSTIGWPMDRGATYITEASHCADTTSLKDTDSDEMKASKRRIDELIGIWLR